MSFFSDLSVSNQVQALYVGYYGRPADPAGLSFWVNQINSQGTSAVINAFGNSAEATELFAGTSAEQQVRAVYRAVLGREVSNDDPGLAFYTTRLESGVFTLASLSLNVIDGVQGPDVPALAARVQAANDFTNALDTLQERNDYSGSSALVVGRAYLAPVRDPATLNQADEDSAILSLRPGNTADLTVQSDTLIGVAGRNDIFNAAAGTLNMADVVLDQSAVDNDVLNLTLTAPSAAARIEGIEQVRVNWDAFGVATVDAINIKGAIITGSSQKLGFQGDFTVNGVGANAVVAGNGMTGALTARNVTDAVVTGTAAKSVTVSGTTSTTDKATVEAGVTTASVMLTGLEQVAVDARAAVKDAIVNVSGSTGANDTLTVQIGNDATVTTSGYGASEQVKLAIAAGKTVTLTANASPTESFAVSGAGNVSVKSTVANLNGDTLDKANAGSLSLELSGSVSNNVVFDATKLFADATKFAGQVGNTTDFAAIFLRNGQQIELAGAANKVAIDNSANDLVSATVLLSNASAGELLANSATVALQAAAATAPGLASAVDLTITQLTVNAATLSGGNDVRITDLAAVSLDASALTRSLTIDTVTGGSTIKGGQGINTVTFSSADAAEQSVETQSAADMIDFGTLDENARATAVTGAGNDIIKANVGTISYAQGAFVVVAGAGNDRLELAGTSQAGANLVFDFGAGTDTLALGGTLQDGNITLQGLESIDIGIGMSNAIGGNLVTGQAFNILSTVDSAANARLNINAEGGSLDASKLLLSNGAETSVAGVNVVGSAGNDTVIGSNGDDTISGGAGTNVLVGGNGDDVITLSASGAKDVTAGLAGDDTIEIEMDTVAALDEVHLRSIDGTDTVNGIVLDEADLAATNDFIAFLDNGNASAGSVNFSAKDTEAGSFGTRFVTADEGLAAGASYAEFAQFAELSDTNAMLNMNQSNKVIVITGDGSTVEAFTTAGLANAYIAVVKDGGVSVFFDSNWADTANRTEVVKLTGVMIGDIDVTDFGVYSTNSGGIEG